MILFVLAIFCASLATHVSAQVKKSKLRVLYVGGSADWSKEHFNDDVAFQNNVKERMASFEKMLKTYFTSVTIVNADDYSQQMSNDYDVTVMDGTPKSIIPEFVDMAKQMYLKAGYFTSDFDQPVLTIGELGATLGSRVGSKNDWYCLCLDADAHSWRKDHPIFKGPFPVKMTVVNKPTPAEAFHYAHDYDGEMPKKLPMWKVQTKGYATDKGFRVGLVSRPWGYEDSPEAEYISSGVCQKSLNAVAIGRHANFFHWGFAASPTYMTDEAISVLANAIAYIAKFKGQGMIARKYNEGIATRATLNEFKYIPTKEAYKNMLEINNEANRLLQKMSKEVQAKQDRGEKLTEEEQYYLNFKPMQMRSHEEVVKLYMREYYDMFGMDEKAYASYFDENRDYFYGGDGVNKLVVDEDVKSLGIPNNDLRLIDTAIKMLENKTEVDKAKRILARYTLVDFPAAIEWRNWFEKNKKKMFFTESGGWVFLVDSREPGVNDYVAWEVRKKLNSLTMNETDERNPVAVVVSREVLQSGEQFVYIKVKIHPGFHIYANVASDAPFVPTKIDIQLPEGYEKVGGLQVPAARFYSQSGTTIYDETVVFGQKIAGKGPGTIECVISYQSCDNHICFPPTEQKFSIQVN